MSNRRFLILCALLLAGTGASFAVGVPRAGYRGLKIPFSRFPTTLQGWTGKDVPLKPRAIRIAGMDRYLRREYSAPGKRPVVLYVAYYGDERRGLDSIYHNPEVCFPSSGWKRVRSEAKSVTLPDAARQIPVTIDFFRQGADQLAVLSFFIVNGRFMKDSPRNAPLALALEKLSSAGPGYFVQAQVVTRVRGGAEERAAERDIGFLEIAGRRILLHVL